MPAKPLSAAQRTALIETLRARFDAHPHRHPKLAWKAVEARLTDNAAALRALHVMEESGGEPDVVVLDAAAKAITFVDCATQSPKGRRSVCYDQQALDARKENKPKHSAQAMAAEFGAALLTVEQYAALQALEAVDTTTSSWLETPARIRALGGALFGDRRYDTVFTYHNGAESYYAARGFRCVLTL